jgi:diguanylate cyclase (GGDEF)-like protein
MQLARPDHQLFIEQQRLLYKNSTGPTIISIPIASFLCWYLRHVIEPTILFSWLSVFILIALTRLFLVFLTHQAEKTSRHNGRLDLFFLGGIWLSAIAWGTASFLLFPSTSPVHQTVFAITIAGVSAGAIASLCSNRSAIVGFLTATLLPLSAKFLLVQEQNGMVLGILVVLYWFVCMSGAQKLHSNITENISLRLKVEYQASYDSLTGLPNRRQLFKQLEEELSRATRHGQNGAVLFIDLDNFKTINDALGHGAGDAVLRHVAEQLLRNLRKEDITARMGGDEFVILLPLLDHNIETAAQKSQEIAKKLTKVLSASFSIDSREMNITPSIGISLFPDRGKGAEDILKQADTAMNQAKTAGRNTARFFLPDMQEAADKRLRLANDLKKAIENDEFSVYFQPQVQADGTIVGAEGLVRWMHPTRGMIMPGEFISAAEENGIIVDIGNCVLRKICRTVKEWEDNHLLKEHQTIAVNISAREFSTPDFVDRIIDTLKKTGIKPHHLDIELTEGSLISSVRDTIDKIQTLRDFGIKFSVDDFGTGYSSLSYLKSLPLHTLKIDRSFVNDIQSVGNGVNLVEIIITMAHNLGLEVVAEGVETAEELSYLAEKGCSVYQGYYFCKPVPIAEFSTMLQAGNVGKTG